MAAWLGPAISAVAGLLGGRRAEKREAAAIAAQNAYNDPSAIRARAEKAGFNPLAFIGPGVGLQTSVGGTDFMSSAIANAGMMLGDALASSGKAATAAKLNQYQQQNQRLQSQVQRLTLRPKVGGIYAGHEATPTKAQATRYVPTIAGDPRLDDPVVLPDGVSGGVGIPDPRLDRGSGTYVAGAYWEPSPGWSSGNTYENEYGEWGGGLMGLAKLGADVVYNAKRTGAKRVAQWRDQMPQIRMMAPPQNPLLDGLKSYQKRKTKRPSALGF